MLRRRIGLALLIAVLSALTTLTVAAPPAAADTGGCNSDQPIGKYLASITPSGSTIRRNIYAKVCLAWNNDTGLVHNSTFVLCRTDNLAPCDIRAEVLSAKVDKYNNAGTYTGTLVDEFFPAYQSGYMDRWSWQGTNKACSGTGYYQANDFNIRVRLGADGVLYNVGNAFGKKIALPLCF